MIIKRALDNQSFQTTKFWTNVNAAYSDFFQKIMTVIDKIVSFKAKRVNGNTQKWFDGEVVEKINSRDKLFQKSKKSRLHIDKELFKKAKYNALKLTAIKKQAFVKETISESIGKPTELWESLKYLDMPSKTLISNSNFVR